MLGLVRWRDGARGGGLGEMKLARLRVEAEEHRAPTGKAAKAEWRDG